MSATDIIKAHILAEYLPGTPSEELDVGYDLLNNGVIDSLGLLSLIDWVEQRFRIPIADLEVSPDDFRSVEAINTFIEKATMVTERRTT
jgi:acyl carrier protein